MAEEQKPDETPQDETPQATDDDAQVGRVGTQEVEQIAQSATPPSEYPEGQADEMEESLPEDANGLEKTVVEAERAAEELSDAGPIKAFGETVSKIQDSIEAVPGAPDTPEEALSHDTHGDTTTFLGREFPVPIYTMVFFALAALTLTEVILAELLINVEEIKIPVLFTIAIAKSFLVVLYYMHLREDSRVFALTLAVPVGIVTLSLLFLIAVPSTGY
jgi:caa(3)-type oxidase subunit IV